MGYNKGNYIFASANIRALEKSLLTEKHVSKMLSCTERAEAMRVLDDLGYQRLSDGPESEDEKIAAVLSAELSKAYESVRGILADPHALDCLSCVYDYHNAKVLLKAEIAGISPDAFLSDCGNLPVSEIKEKIAARDLASLSPNMRDAVLKAVESYAVNKDPGSIDLILDEACFADMLGMASCAYLKKYVVLLIDSLNLKTALRLKAMGEGRAMLDKAFIKGGDLPEDVLQHIFDEDCEHFADRLISYRGFKEVMKKGGEHFERTGSFTVLEAMLDDELIEYAKSAKLASYGIEIPAAYIIAKENDIKLLRIVLSAIKQGLTGDELKNRLRRTYV